jgi:hypothetical protein
VVIDKQKAAINPKRLVAFVMPRTLFFTRFFTPAF